jgi:nicotinamidase-related amidase
MVDRRSFLEAGVGLATTAALAGRIASRAGRADAIQQPPPGGPSAADFRAIPQRTAFINVDLQNCFVEGYPVSSPQGPALLRRINAFAAECRGAGVKVIHTAHILRPDGSNAGVLGEYLQAIREGMINRGSHSAALHKDLVIDQRDIVLEKPRFGAFHGTDLELILRSNGIDAVIIGGIATNICCETTAREATVRDFRLFFLSDGTAPFTFGDVTADQAQQATCMSLRLFGEVLTMDRMLGKLRAATA